MKILYGIQGTGNGHISKASTIYPVLKEVSNDVDVLISGNNYSLQPCFPVKYASDGISFKTINGRISYSKTLRNINLFRFFSNMKSIPFKSYDLIVSDFDPLSAYGAKRNKIPSIQISHQASFLSPKTPRPKNKNIIAEWILKYFAPTDHYIGLHFNNYDDTISGPIIKESILKSVIIEGDHITIYLPWYELDDLSYLFNKVKDVNFHIFTKEVCSKTKKNNITFFPIDEQMFTKSMSSSKGVICNAGFETPSEALFLGKRLIVIPLNGQYEQLCNAIALEKMGIGSVHHLNELSEQKIYNWLKSKPVKISFDNNISEIIKQKIYSLQHVF